MLFVSTFLWLLPFDMPKSSTSSLNSITLSPLSSIMNDLTQQGIIKTGNKALFLAAGGNYHGLGVVIDDKHRYYNATDVLANGGSFDFVFTNDFRSNISEVIDKVVKVGGVLAIRLTNNPSAVFQKPENYRIVYLQHYGSTFMAMRKTH